MKQRFLAVVVLALVALCTVFLTWRERRSDPLSGRGEPSGNEAGSEVVSQALDGSRRLEVEGEARQPLRADESLSSSRIPALSGRILGPDGSPIGGARILAGRDPGFPTRIDSRAFSEPELESERQSTTSDDQGRFRFSHIDPGQLLLGVRHPGHAPFDQRLELRRERSLDVGDIVLEKGVVLEGRVVDPAGGGVPDAALVQIVLEPGLLESRLERLGREISAARSDEQGGFVLDSLATGSWRFRVESASHPSKVFAGHSWNAGVDGGHLFQLEPGLSLSGYVSGDLAGHAPIEVRALLKQQPGSHVELPREHRLQRAVCEASGSFRVGLFPLEAARHEYRLCAFAGGQPISGEVLARPGEDDVKLEVWPTCAVEFELRDSRDGKVLLDPVLSLAHWSGGAEINAQPVPPGNVQVDPSTGRFRVRVACAGEEGAAGGRATRGLSVAKEGYSSFVQPDLGLSPGSQVDLGRIELFPRPLLDVRVVDAAGEAVQGATVHVAPADTADMTEAPMGPNGRLFATAWGTARTNVEGRCSVALVVGGTSLVTATHPEFAPVAPLVVPASAPPRALVLTLAEGAQVLLFVQDTQGEPQPGAIVWHRYGAQNPLATALRRHGPEIEQRTADEHGSSLFERLGPGLHAFAARRSDGEPPADWVDLEVPPSGSVELHLEVPERVPVTGRVLLDGAPLAGANVFLAVRRAVTTPLAVLGVLPSSQPALRTRTDSSGFFELDDVEAGPSWLELRHADLAVPVVREIAVADNPTHVEVALRGGSLRGRVLDENGRPLAGARVHALSSDEAAERIPLLLAFGSADGPAKSKAEPPVLTDPEGQFRFTGLPSTQEFVVVAVSGGYQPCVSDPVRGMAADEEANTELDLTLRRAGRLQVSIWTRSGRSPRWSNVCGVQVTRQEGSGSALDRRLFPLPDGSPPVSISIDHLAPGDWRVTLLDCVGGALPDSVLTNVVADDTESVVFELSDR